MALETLLRNARRFAVSCLQHDPRQTTAQDRSQARSMVISRNGIVAAESPLPRGRRAHPGARWKCRGCGNRHERHDGRGLPMMNGIGGDLFAIVYDAKANKLYGLNASGWAPKGLTIEALHKLGLREMPDSGIHTIYRPGAVDGWQKLADKFGRKKLGEDLAARSTQRRMAIPVTEWWRCTGKCRDYCAAMNCRQLYLPQDRPPKTGEVFRTRNLPGSLQQIAEHGRDAFYKGEIARRIMETMKRHGGTMHRRRPGRILQRVG